MEGVSSSTRMKYFYPPTKSIMLASVKPGEKIEPGHKQVYRKSGPVVQHRDAPEPYPPRRFHPGDPSDAFVLKGGTVNYVDGESKTINIPDKDHANFYGVLTKLSFWKKWLCLIRIIIRIVWYCNKISL